MGLDLLIVDKNNKCVSAVRCNWLWNFEFRDLMFWGHWISGRDTITSEDARVYLHDWENFRKIEELDDVLIEKVEELKHALRDSSEKGYAAHWSY